MNLLLLREGELPPAGIVDGRADAFLPGPAELACHAGEDVIRLFPSRPFCRGNNRADGHVEADGAAVFRSARPECGDALRGGCTRLRVDREHVALG